MSSEAKIILAFLSLFFVGGFVLFREEKINHDYQYQKQWTAFYFSKPKSDSLDFIIENFEGKKVVYNYSLRDEESDKEILKDSISLEAKEKKEIVVEEKIKKGLILLQYEDQEKSLFRR